MILIKFRIRILLRRFSITGTIGRDNRAASVSSSIQPHPGSVSGVPVCLSRERKDSSSIIYAQLRVK